MTGAVGPFERLLHRDQVLVAIGLATVTLLAWGYLLTGAGIEMPAMSVPMETAQMPGWSSGQAALMFVMWWVMMMAMMLPSAAPMILLFSSVARRSSRPGGTTIFVMGYLLVWGGFSVIATLMQWQLTRIGLLDAMRANSQMLAGLLLLVAGIYQLTPAKTACLRHCQSPLRFVTEHWRPRTFGALKMGLRHGGYCLGCCWALMALLFVGGVMNIAWIGGLAAYVLIEKIIPQRRYFGLISACLLITAGAVLLGLPVS
jgi:predicted metal-binding membrane protein